MRKLKVYCGLDLLRMLKEGSSSTITSRATSSALTGVSATIKTAQRISWTTDIWLTNTPAIGGSSCAGLNWWKVVHVWTALLSTENY